MGKQPRKRRSFGWAYTKKYPHLNHPAYYRKQDLDDIEYVTFTHSELVEFDDEPVPVSTRKLNYNIDKKQKNNPKDSKGYSHVVPRVYQGKRSALGNETSKYRIHSEDWSLIGSIFKSGKRIKVPYTSNSSKKTKK